MSSEATNVRWNAPVPVEFTRTELLLIFGALVALGRKDDFARDLIEKTSGAIKKGE